MKKIVHAPSPGLVYLLAFGVPFLVILASWMQPWVPAGELVRDPLAIAESKAPGCCAAHYGAVSNLGVVVFTISAATSLFAAFALRHRPATPVRRVLVLGGVLTLVMTADDLYLLHEKAFPHLLGLDEKVVFAGYGIVGLVYVISLLRLDMPKETVLLFLSCMAFACSLALDFGPLSDKLGLYSGRQRLLEDGAKLTGMFSWMVFHMRFASAVLHRELGRPETAV